MGIREFESPLHWRYFLALEEDVVSLSRYIEFTKNNFSTYSTELSSILLGAGSEVDVVAKQVCRTINSKTKASHIGHYAAQIHAAYPNVGRFELTVPRFGLVLRPWDSWAGKSRKSPLWWRAYNNVKHSRHTHYQEANLKNALNAVGGLLILTLFLYRKSASEGRLSPNPVVFRPAERFQSGTTCWDTEMLINYKLT